MLVPNRSAQEHADTAPAAGLRGLPPLFAGALETLRPEIFRLPPTSEAALDAAIGGAAGVSPQLFRPELSASPTQVRTVAAPVAVAKLDEAADDITGSLPPVAAAADSPSRQLDLPPVGMGESPPLAGLDTPDVITRGAPGDPGTFPPMMVVERPFFTIDPVALPQAPLDYLAPGTELMPAARPGRKNTRS